MLSRLKWNTDLQMWINPQKHSGTKNSKDINGITMINLLLQNVAKTELLVLALSNECLVNVE